MNQLPANVRTSVGVVEEVIDRRVERGNCVSLSVREICGSDSAGTIRTSRNDYWTRVIDIGQQCLLGDIVSIDIPVGHHWVEVIRNIDRIIKDPGLLHV